MCRSLFAGAVASMGTDDDDAPNDFAAHMVQLVPTDSAHEAQEFADYLRARGIAAIAKATEVPEPPGLRGRAPTYRSCVMVLAADKQRARAALDEQFEPEGGATDDEIEAELRAAREREESAEIEELDADAEWELGSERWSDRAGRMLWLAVKGMLVILALAVVLRSLGWIG